MEDGEFVDLRRVMFLQVYVLVIPWGMVSEKI